MQRCQPPHRILAVMAIPFLWVPLPSSAVVLPATPPPAQPQAAAPPLGACQNRQTGLFGLCRIDGSAAPPVVAQRFAFIGAAGSGTEADRFPARLQPSDPLGYLDSRGEWAVKPQYTQALPFSEGLAVVSDGARFAAIDRSGDIAVPWFEGLMYPFSQGLACVVPGGSIRLGWAGRWRQRLFGSPADDLYAAPWWHLEGRVGFVDTAGRMAIAPRFDPKLNFVTGGCGFSPAGYAAMRQDGQEGLIDRQGRWVIEPRYEYLGMVFSGNRKVVAVIADRLLRPGIFLDTIERLDGGMVPGQPVRWREKTEQEIVVGGGLGRALLNQLLFPRWQRDLLNDDVSAHTLTAWVGSVVLALGAVVAIFRGMRRSRIGARALLALVVGGATLAFTFLAGVITLFSTAAFGLAAVAVVAVKRWRRRRQTGRSRAQAGN